MENSKKIFIIEDDPFYSALLHSFLKLKGYRDIHVFSKGTEALQQLEEQPDLILIDFDLGDSAYPGKRVLQEIRRINEQIPVIFISGQKSIHEAIQTLKFGAMDYIQKSDHTLERLDRKINELFHPTSVLTSMDIQKKNKRHKFFMGGIFFILALGISISYM
ncbi:MAG: response regulator [Bacteroidia bacterium]|nr:response regulator [Bacteroidia bacterium]